VTHGEEVNFFDQRDLELGVAWKRELLDALQMARTLVCVYSPAYFISEYCGKEWQVFQMRREKYLRDEQAAGRGGAKLPPVIKPILWVPFEHNLPAVVTEAQYKRGDPASVINKEGLFYVVKQYSKYRFLYNEFIHELAKEIQAAADQHAVGPLDGPLDMDQVLNAFAAAPPPAPGAPQVAAVLPPETGPKCVQFVFVAGNPQEFPPGLRTTLDCYKDAGGGDWQPFYPRKRRIGSLAVHIASDEDLDFIPSELPFSPNLAQDVSQAEKERRLVVLVVDSWTAELPPYQQVLQDFDRRNYFNCSVVVPWNEGDLETAQRRAALEQTILSAFPFRAVVKHPVYFRDAIRSEAELCEQLREVLIRLKEEVINKAKVTRPVPSGGAKPAIVGPGSGGGK
jgi:FxsC-like protein